MQAHNVLARPEAGSFDGHLANKHLANGHLASGHPANGHLARVAERRADKGVRGGARLVHPSVHPAPRAAGH